MAAQTNKEIGLEVGHVLFIDIVGYSKLLINVLLTPAFLRLDPLRNDPRFQKLCEEKPK